MPERLKLIKQWLQNDLRLAGFAVTPASVDASFGLGEALVSGLVNISCLRNQLLLIMRILV